MTSLASPIITSSRRPQWVLAPLPYDTVPKLFWQQAGKLGSQVMMRQKDLGIWKAYSWAEVGGIVSEIGAGLVSLGFEPGELVSVMANTCREWVWADLAAQTMGGICSGIYPTDAPEQLRYLCSDSRSVFLFVEDDEQLDKVLECRGRCPTLRQIVIFDMEGLRDFADPMVVSMNDFMAQGRAHRTGREALWNDMVNARKPADLADDLAHLGPAVGLPDTQVLLPHHHRAAQFAGLLPEQLGHGVVGQRRQHPLGPARGRDDGGGE